MTAACRAAESAAAKVLSRRRKDLRARAETRHRATASPAIRATDRRASAFCCLRCLRILVHRRSAHRPALRARRRSKIPTRRISTRRRATAALQHVRACFAPRQRMRCRARSRRRASQRERAVEARHSATTRRAARWAASFDAVLKARRPAQRRAQCRRAAAPRCGSTTARTVLHALSCEKSAWRRAPSAARAFVTAVRCCMAAHRFERSAPARQARSALTRPRRTRNATATWNRRYTARRRSHARRSCEWTMPATARRACSVLDARRRALWPHLASDALRRRRFFTARARRVVLVRNSHRFHTRTACRAASVGA